jgi:NAD-dependent deacetylase
VVRQRDLKLLADRIRKAQVVTVITGAGVSAASGVPTFRGARGLWRNYHPEELASPQAFARDPRLVWEWYDWRRQTIAGCAPNRAHEVIAAWSQRCRNFTLITQNVDGLHERAGTRNIVRFHGSIWDVYCAARCRRSRPPFRDERVPMPEIPPRCEACGGPLRPAVIWFGEPIDAIVADLATRSVQCDVFLSIGTSSLVFPAASLLYEAKVSGAFTCEINPQTTQASAHVDLVLRGRAERILDALEHRIQNPVTRRRAVAQM